MSAWYGPCACCGLDYYSHRTKDMKCKGRKTTYTPIFYTPGAPE